MTGRSVAGIRDGIDRVCLAAMLLLAAAAATPLPPRNRRGGQRTMKQGAPAEIDRL